MGIRVGTRLGRSSWVSIGGSFPTMAGLGILAATFALMWWMFKWTVIAAILLCVLLWVLASTGMQWLLERRAGARSETPPTT